MTSERDTDRLRVLVPVDFSETSRRALAWAFDYATRAPCELHLLHVVEDSWRDAFSTRLQEKLDDELWAVTKEAQTELERMVPDVEEREALGPIRRHVARGRPAQEILRIATDLDAEMIVMGTHGRTGVPHMLIGSVAEKVVRHAQCPVVCVKPGKER